MTIEQVITAFTAATTEQSYRAAKRLAGRLNPKSQQLAIVDSMLDAHARLRSAAVRTDA